MLTKSNVQSFLGEEHAAKNIDIGQHLSGKAYSREQNIFGSESMRCSLSLAGKLPAGDP